MKLNKILCTLSLGLIIGMMMSSCDGEASFEDSNAQIHLLTDDPIDAGYCNQTTHPINDYQEGADLINAFIYVELDYDQEQGLDTREKYYDHYVAMAPENTTAVATFDLHATKFNELGHDGYLDFAASQGIISTALSDYIKGFKLAFDDFVTTTQPDYTQYQTYLENQGSLLEGNASLCEYDRYVAKLYHVLLLGTGKYIYDNYYDANLQSLAIGLRDGCTGFWERLTCITAGSVVGVAVGISLGLWKNLKSIFTSGDDEKIVDIGKALYYIFKISVDAWKAGINFYDWCCDILSGPELQECEAPVAAYATAQECGLYEIRVVGQGLYSTTFWKNENTDPKETITPFPRLDVIIPDPSIQSVINGEVTCTDNNGNDNKEFTFFMQFDPLDYTFSSPQWGYNPPSNAFLNQTYEISVTNPPDDNSLYTMAWSAGFGCSISPIGDINSGKATLTGFISGTHKVEVIYTHICSGQQQKKSKMVNFN